MFRRHRRPSIDSDLDITSFMNLMIILVPVLLMSMVFSQITVLDLKLPGLSDGSDSPDQLKNQRLELVLRQDFIDVNYPSGVRLKRIPKLEETGEHDYPMLSKVLQEVKRLLKEKEVEKKDLFLLSEPDTDYQVIISTMDTARSYKAVLITDVVDAELFPEISLGDAPEIAGEKTDKEGAQ
jgi:biopolymer transport protein ExbD